MLEATSGLVDKLREIVKCEPAKRHRVRDIDCVPVVALWRIEDPGLKDEQVATLNRDATLSRFAFIDQPVNALGAG